MNGEWWLAMQQLLTIFRIVFSVKITDNDIKTLEQNIEAFLKFLIAHAKLHILPKHHFMVHYPYVIGVMGPLIHMWTMRMESKHKIFTDIFKLTSNFKNAPKTLSIVHQERQFYKQNKFSESIESSKTGYDIRQRPNIDKTILINTEEFNYAFSFIKYGTTEYRPGLFILQNSKAYEIEHILQKNHDYIILCSPYKILKFEQSLNAINIEREVGLDNFVLFLLSDLDYKETYQKHILNNKFYIVADTLFVFNTSQIIE